MSPQEVILEVLDESWSFEGGSLIKADREGGCTAAATVKGSFPVRVEFLEDNIPNIQAADEDQLRAQLKTLSEFQAFRLRFNPRS